MKLTNTKKAFVLYSTKQKELMKKYRYAYSTNLVESVNEELYLNDCQFRIAYQLDCLLAGIKCTWQDVKHLPIFFLVQLST